MRTYLSIDLDYWTFIDSKTLDYQPFIDCDEFFAKVLKLKLPITYVRHHHVLLRAINSVPDLDCVVNVDYHSDLADINLDCEKNAELNPGTWGNFIYCRSHGTFQWNYPFDKCKGDFTGYCHSIEENNPFKNSSHSGWARAEHTHGIKEIPWKTIVGVGVCLSPNYTTRFSAVEKSLKKMGMLTWAKRGIYEYKQGNSYPHGNRYRKMKIVEQHEAL